MEKDPLATVGLEGIRNLSLIGKPVILHVCHSKRLTCSVNVRELRISDHQGVASQSRVIVSLECNLIDLPNLLEEIQLQAGERYYFGRVVRITKGQKCELRVDLGSVAQFVA